MTTKRKSIFVFGIALIGIAIAIVYFIFTQKNNDRKQFLKGDKASCLKENETATYEIEDKKDAPSIAKITIKNKDTNKQVFDFRIDKIIPNHYHLYELHKCGIYTVREFNYDYRKGQPSSDFRIELWRYYYNGIGEKIVKENDFRVDPKEQYIVLERSYVGKDDYALVIKDLDTLGDLLVLSMKDILTENPNIVPGSFSLGQWSENGKYLYGDLFQGALSTAYYRIETGTWEVDVFPGPPDILAGVERNINFHNLRLAYVDIPTFTGLQEVYEAIIEKAKREGKEKNLFVYNLVTKEKTKVASTLPDKRFNIKWLSHTELEYELPTGEKKTYKINE